MALGLFAPQLFLLIDEGQRGRPRYARSDPQQPALLGGVVGNVLRVLGPWTYQAHIAHQDV